MSSPAALHPTRTQVGVESTLLFACMACALIVLVSWAFVCRKAPILRMQRAKPRARWTNPTTKHVVGDADDDGGTATGTSGSVGSSEDADGDTSSIKV
jgi:hypothetical protein